MEYEVNIGSSDEEDSFDEMVQMLPQPRRFIVAPDFFSSLNDREFRERFRLNKSTIMDLAELIFVKLEPLNKRRNTVTPMNQLLITLRFYATGVIQQVNADMFNVVQPTISKIVKKVTRVLCELRPQFIQMPTTDQNITLTKRNFFNMVDPNGIPGVVGLIDCTHVKIESPGGVDAERFRNRKGYFSVNVQVIGNVDLSIMDIEARWPGASHDSYIFDMSAVKVIY